MNFSQLIGLTSQNLYEKIIKSPTGFSVEDDSIQYLGRQIQLQDGLTVLSEDSFDTTGGKNLLDRIVNLHPDFAALLPDAKAEAIKRCARQLIKEFLFIDAIKNSPTKEVQFAVINEGMNENISSTISDICQTDTLSTAEKLRFFSIAEEKAKRPMAPRYWSRSGIPLSVRLKKTKELFQNVPNTPPFDKAAKPVHNMYITIASEPFEDIIKEIRDVFESEDNELSRQLLKEVDNLEKKFTPKVGARGLLDPWHIEMKFTEFLNKLLYLYAACAGFLKDNIDELISYITSILHNDSPELTHYVKELCYLSKQPGAVGYARYIDAVADVLKKPEKVVSNYEVIKQLSDTRGFCLLQSNKTLAPYLTALKADIENMIPEYSDILLPEVAKLERDFAKKSLSEDEPDIRATVHRLLMVISACKSSEQKINISLLAPFVPAIMKHGNKQNIPYLISGLARLVQSTPKIQQILGGPGNLGGDHLRLAPLQLLALAPNKMSEDGLEKLCKSLQASGASRRKIKDGKVFHQWLATLEEASASEFTNKAMLMPILEKLAQNLTFEKLGLLHMIFKMGENFDEFLDSMGFDCQKEGLPLLIAEKGADALGKSNGVSKWLIKQRHFHLLPLYMVSMTRLCNKLGDRELIDLIHEFVESSSNNTFIENRQSPLNNRHLQAIYQKYPEFEAGWGAIFSDFNKETRNKHLSQGETLELTEDPWDLFISGLEAQTCQSPEGLLINRALMSLVMDGRNAMIVRKNQKGNILGRSVIRMVFDQKDCPALFLETGYPGHRALLFIDAAREIADQMKLPLYHHLDTKKGEADTAGEKVKLLEGRAPFDYFDSLGDIKKRQEVTFSKVKRDVRHPSQDRH